MAVINRHSAKDSGLESPADDAFAITKHDTNNLAEITRAIFVGGAGDVAVVMRGGGSVIYKGCTAGSIIPVRAKKVLSTGTTATDLVGMV